MRTFGRFYDDGRCMRSVSEATAVFQRAQRAAHARSGGRIVDQDTDAVRPAIVNVAVLGTFRVGGQFAANTRAGTA